MAGIGENAGKQHFLLSTTLCFKRPLCPGHLKLGLSGKGLTLMILIMTSAAFVDWSVKINGRMRSIYSLIYAVCMLCQIYCQK